MGTSRADRLRELGQSVWMDIIRRGQLISGEFERAVREDGVVGVTSNPTIFQLAISESNDYDAAIQQGIASGSTAPSCSSHWRSKTSGSPATACGPPSSRPAAWTAASASR